MSATPANAATGKARAPVANSSAAAKPHRDTIFIDDAAEVVRQTAFEAEQFVIRVRAPKCAAAATPGSFAHLTCDEALPMRRPLSIMRASADEGWIDILYKIHGPGLRALSTRKAGDRISVLGPIGRGFEAHTQRPRALLIGGGVGIPPMVFLAETLSAQNAQASRTHDSGDDPGDASGGRHGSRTGGDSHRGTAAPLWKPLALFGSEIPFPFRARPSTIIASGIPAGTIACMPLLDEWGVPSRLATKAGYAGCFDGFVTDLAAEYLRALDQATRREIEIFACGPTPMLAAVARVAQKFEVPAQVSLEEFMACAVGGCAGCAVRVHTDAGPAMKRVCVDGPVFDANAVFPRQLTPESGDSRATRANRVP